MRKKLPSYSYEESYTAIFKRETAEDGSPVQRWIYLGPDCRVGTYHITSGTSLFEVAEHPKMLCLRTGGQTLTPILYKPEEGQYVAD